jgi:hypothetical protein
VGEGMRSPTMKSLTWMGLLVAIILTAVSLYAVEDIPAFGDENSAVNKYIKLFAIDANPRLVENLNSGTLPEEIREDSYKPTVFLISKSIYTIITII